MRSRFSAFAVGDAGYLLETWHPSTRPASLELDEGIRWFRLDIVDRVAGGLLDDTGTVEFIARYRMRPPAATAEPTGERATAGEQHERSRFERMNSRWFYVDAV